MGAISDYIRKIVVEEIAKEFNAEQVEGEGILTMEQSETIQSNPPAETIQSNTPTETDQSNPQQYDDPLLSKETIERISEALYRQNAKHVNLDDSNSGEQTDVFAKVLGLA